MTTALPAERPRTPEYATCAALLRDPDRPGARCANPPMAGGSVCRLHGGSAPQTRAAAARRWLAEQFADGRSELARWHRELCDTQPVNVYRALHELNVACHWLVQVLAAQLRDEDYRGPTPAFLAYERALDRSARVAKLCADAQVAERYVNLAELQGETIHRLLTGAFDRCPSITAEQRQEFGAALRAAFEAQRALPAGATSTPAHVDSRLPLRGATP